MALLADPPPDRPDAGRYRQAVGEFVRLWGDMASAWGINRTMAQIHALLYASELPLDTDEIMDRLQISRGNANMNLRALVDWNLVRRTHQPGSRRDFFVAETDVWAITATIIEERRRREIQPVRQALGELAAGLRAPDAATPEAAALAARVEALVAFMETFDAFTSAVLPLLRTRNAETVRRVVRFAAGFRPASGSTDDSPDDDIR